MINYAVAKGAAKTYEEANLTILGKYLMPNCLSDLGECGMYDFCKLVKQANGVPVLAHPGYLNRQNPDRFVAMHIQYNKDKSEKPRKIKA